MKIYLKTFQKCRRGRHLGRF